MISRHGKFQLDLENCTVEDEHGNRYAQSDSWGGLESKIEGSDMGFRGERDSMLTRIMAARRARDSDPADGGDGISEPVARHFRFRKIEPGLLHREVPTEEIQEPVVLFFHPEDEVWGVFHDGRRLATYERFLVSAYAAEQLAADVHTLEQSDTAQLPE